MGDPIGIRHGRCRFRAASRSLAFVLVLSSLLITSSISLAGGKALVKLDTKITDSADHAESLTRTCPVSDQPIRVSFLPEGGRLMIMMIIIIIIPKY